MSLEEVAMAAAELLEAMAKQSPPPPVLLWHKGPQIAKMIRYALRAEKADPVSWTNEEAARNALAALERYQIKRQDFDRFADEIEALRAALAEAEPVAWTNECAAELAWTAGFSGTSWSMGPEELAHVLNTAQVPRRRELSDEEIAACLPGAEPFFALVGSEEILKFAHAVLLRAAGGEG